MATARQRTAARRNVRKAAKAAKRKKTISSLSERTRTALGKEGAKAARRKRAQQLTRAFRHPRVGGDPSGSSDSDGSPPTRG